MAMISIKGEVQIHLSAEEVRSICAGLAGLKTGTQPAIRGADISHAIKAAFLQAATSNNPKPDQKKLVRVQGHARVEEDVSVIDFIPEGQ
jgi:hypothetical protein